MTTRTRKEGVTFKRPFALGGVDGLRPAGAYEVETDEQLVEGASITAYRRMATRIRLPMTPGRPRVTEIVTVDPKDLNAALRRDAEPWRATVVRNSAGPPNQTGTNSRDEKADLAAEERSEDEGMTEHANKAADPVAWAANRAAADTGPGPARGRQSS